MTLTAKKAKPIFIFSCYSGNVEPTLYETDPGTIQGNPALWLKCYQKILKAYSMNVEDAKEPFERVRWWHILLLWPWEGDVSGLISFSSSQIVWSYRQTELLRLFQLLLLIWANSISNPRLYVPNIRVLWKLYNGLTTIVDIRFLCCNGVIIYTPFTVVNFRTDLRHYAEKYDSS